jgi:hypothetical protein
MVGGPAQNLSNFQMAPIPILSVLTCSTSSPRDILKVSEKKSTITCPLGGSNVSLLIRVGLLVEFSWVLTRFDIECTVLLVLHPNFWS